MAGGSTTGADAALAELCERYWFPVYAFVRRTGAATDDAADLTQAFFARVLEKGYLKSATPVRGRFRSFLLGSLRHFLSNERDWDRALKRGGALVHVSLDFDDGERRYQLEPSSDLTPERIYERRWALQVLDEALTRVAETHVRAGRGPLFQQLKSTLTGNDTLAYPDVAREFGTSEGALRVAVHRLRKQFAAALRATIAETVESPQEIDDELRYLLGVIAR